MKLKKKGKCSGKWARLKYARTLRSPFPFALFFFSGFCLICSLRFANFFQGLPRCISCSRYIACTAEGRAEVRWSRRKTSVYVRNLGGGFRLFMATLERYKLANRMLLFARRFSSSYSWQRSRRKMMILLIMLFFPLFVLSSSAGLPAWRPDHITSHTRTSLYKHEAQWCVDETPVRWRPSAWFVEKGK